MRSYPPILDKLGRGEPRILRPVAGGCIADSRCAEFNDGSRVFVKTAAAPPEMFPAEALGLKALAEAAAIRIPEVLAASSEGLVLEWIEPGPRQTGFFENFGQQFAALHRHRGAQCGFAVDNYIGATPQVNQPLSTDWPEFFMEQRLRYQAALAECNGHGSELLNMLETAETTLSELMSEATEEPSILHGDLWSGNYIVDNKGRAVLIDPAAYYGHREADLAMTRWFGGFDAAFYSAYEEVLPLAPGWHERMEIYRLYHVINHLNLFGSSYYGQAISILQRYSAR